MSGEPAEGPSDFIRHIVRRDVEAGRNDGDVVTRFPPEPNGYLHIGHAKAITISFGVAASFGGRTHLRFDDTNPAAEDTAFVEAIQQDIRWLGFDWGEHLHFTSDRFEHLYGFAIQLIERGHAFVCDLSSEEILARRGSLTEPGIESPYRNRPVEENLDLFARMKSGEFDSGTRVLRAKIDMASPVLPNRDPVLYRIVKEPPHHRTGREWCIYPLYDFAHCLSDALEGITHSLCSLEFVDHRPLYDWILDHVDAPCHPQQIEFGRLGLTHTVMSKRVLRRLVEDDHVAGWDDPRMPTLAGLRRRGYPPEAIRRFCEGTGVSRHNATSELSNLEAAVREQLNEEAPRVMGVLRPLKLVIENYPEDQEEELEAVNNPQDAAAGTRKLPFGRELWIERDDFLEDPPRKFFRLSPGREVRLRYAYLVTCTEAVKDPATGEIVEVRCTYDPATRGGDAPDGRKVKGTIHWVSARHALPAEVRLYETLFDREDPLDVPEGGDWTDALNPHSLEVVSDAQVEPSLAQAAPGQRFQLERLGYFCIDPDSTASEPVLNRSVGLRDTWAKVAKKG